MHTLTCSIHPVLQFEWLHCYWSFDLILQKHEPVHFWVTKLLMLFHLNADQWAFTKKKYLSQTSLECPFGYILLLHFHKFEGLSSDRLNGRVKLKVAAVIYLGWLFYFFSRVSRSNMSLRVRVSSQSHIFVRSFLEKHLSTQDEITLRMVTIVIL